MVPFDYDRWKTTPPEEPEFSHDEDEWVCLGGGRWVYVGDEI